MRSLRASQKAGAPAPLERKAFKVGVILKLIDGIFEIVSAVVVWVVRPTTVIALVRALTADELTEDPHDFIATHAIAWAHQYSNGTRLFAALYLLAHGVVKVVLVVALLRRKLWAYPTLIGFLVLFVAYQCYRLIHTHSVGLCLFTVLDAVIVWLVWREFRRLLRERHAQQPKGGEPGNRSSNQSRRAGTTPMDRATQAVGSSVALFSQRSIAESLS